MVSVRRATGADAVPAWKIRAAAVMTQCHGFYRTSDLQEWVSGPPSLAWIRRVEEAFYVATDADEVVATGMIDTATGKVDAIFVAPDAMGKGVGRMMMNFLEDLARRHGLREMRLEATLNAAPFYRRCGFTGDAIALYRSPRGLEMECVPMLKVLEDRSTA